jgi:phage N-6-adenine-methyltransferase
VKLPGIGSHHSARSKTDEWLTPPRILRALGPFDLDPCSPVDRPWDTAARHLTIADDGLDHPWEGRVWLNPPYSDVESWIRRLAAHDNGIALVFARTETAWWFESIWPRASALLFLRGRITFHHGDGSASRAGHNSGGPSVLVSYGPANADTLAACGLAGAVVDLRLDSADRGAA